MAVKKLTEEEYVTFLKTTTVKKDEIPEIVKRAFSRR